MAIIKCKMCGGDLNIIEGQSVAECEYCGSRQTVPSADNEKKLTLFARANRLRASCEFDKAAGIYESIVADFPEEAEAYWGLVLCKYGIEYVDDPATGKKIPTCHRSSFESIMDDANLELALENADVVARRVYREEAKQIEEIRKGIIAVSSNEEPYDIFICYKETDANGSRTLDSVLAQDIYDALTDKDYRTFFARITLEDKLGQEYEPYIFAALNSAKIMLAVGTDYEYYNAVWVKNEWSRFLKLMTTDKSKHLIPCYKGIDAYDMPKEFARLQAQDLGKMGAIQDILRGVEKLLPRKERNTVVVQQNLSTNAAALLKRGNMALEDSDWISADKFFEEALNQNAECAEAYIGKALVQEKCVSLDALVRQRLSKTAGIKSFDKLCISENKIHIDAAVEKYALLGLLDAREIRSKYHYDLTYTSEVGARKQQKNEELTAWKTNKNLNRAEKFASGETAAQLAAAKNQLVSAMDQRIAKAESDRDASKAALEKSYAGFLEIVDEEVAQKLHEAETAREKQYDRLFQIVKSSDNTVKLTNTADEFAKMGDFRDSKALEKLCRERAREILAEKKRIRDAEEAEKQRIADEKRVAEEAEAERQRVLREKQEKERKAKNKKHAILAAIAAVIVVAVMVVMTTVVIPSGNYSKAEALLAAGEYEEAIAAFEALGDYKDSAAKMQEAADAIQAAEDVRIAQEKADSYTQALLLIEVGEYQQALSILYELGDYEDSKAMAESCQMEMDYSAALTCLESGQDEQAYEMLCRLGDYKDAEQYLAQFVPVLTEQTSTWYDGSGNNLQYIYGSNMQLESIKYDGEVRYAFFYHEDGTLKQREEVFSNGIRVHTYNEKGHPIFFGQFNDKKAAYEFSWFFEYTYDTAGNATSISGRYFCGDEEADYTWNMSLSQGDTIEITDLAIGMEHLADAADNRHIISILRKGGTVREQYDFRFVNLNSYKDGIAMDFIVSPRFVHQLDDAGNVVRTEIRSLSAGGYEIFGETDFTLTYNESGYLVEKSYNDSTSNYNDYILSVNGLHGNNVLSYIMDENNQVTGVKWTLGGKLLRTDNFTYNYFYMPESQSPLTP